ncbi:hypothetical protein Q8W41_25460 [Vibrio splendidus]|uniref:hypothetical protein n=1 Tax=Vibrio splendidus TaxID=29497 RepID=UPI002734B225|nr:hypothetical protein [Vibrio splendidus]MDP2592822.1 hypothetical protein [Vibrio splendidus]
MAEHKNPTRGYISCPVCQSVASAHQVGEGKLIATGEPPKNSRNIGLMYYRCPKCGNSSHSHEVTKFIKANLVADSTELQPTVTDKLSVVDPVLITEPNRTEVTELTEGLTEPEETQETSKDAVSNREVTETADDDEAENTQSTFSFKRVITALVSVIFLLWAFSQLLPKPKAITEPTQGGEHGANE